MTTCFGGFVRLKKVQERRDKKLVAIGINTVFEEFAIKGYTQSEQKKRIFINDKS